MLGLSEPVALPVCFQDVAPVGESVQEGAGEPFRAEDLGPLVEGEVGGDDEALPLVGPANHLEKELGAYLGEGDITQLIDDQQLEPLKLFVKALEASFLAAFHQLGDQGGGGVESHPMPLGAGGKGHGAAQMGLAGAGVADQEHVFLLGDVLAPHQLPDQGLVEGGLGLEIKGVQGLDHREGGLLDPPFGGSLFAVQELPLGQAQQVSRVITALFGADPGDGGVLPEHGGQLELFEVVLQKHGGLVPVLHGLPPWASKES